MSGELRHFRETNIAFSVGPTPVSADATRLAFLRATLSAALDLGVRYVDLSESPTPDAALAVTRLAAGDHWPSLTMFVAARPDRDVESSQDRGPTIVRVRPVGEDAEAPSSISGREVGVRFPDLESAERFAALEAGRGVRWISFPGSLIDARRVASVVGSIRTEGARVLVTNPHADGRLGGPGEAFSSSTPTGAPMPLASLERAYAPVLRLGFLTANGGRTLPQAAVAFLIAVGAVPSVRFSDVRQLAAFGVATKLPPIAPEDLARLVGSP
jgi:aryl-alcohol dehydrogenase-like predicted oxidoreductase